MVFTYVVQHFPSSTRRSLYYVHNTQYELDERHGPSVPLYRSKRAGRVVSPAPIASARSERDGPAEQQQVPYVLSTVLNSTKGPQHPLCRPTREDERLVARQLCLVPAVGFNPPMLRALPEGEPRSLFHHGWSCKTAQVFCSVALHSTIDTAAQGASGRTEMIAPRTQKCRPQSAHVSFARYMYGKQTRQDKERHKGISGQNGCVGIF